MNGEFNLIKRYFSKPAPGVKLGVGDDCALLSVPDGYVLATSTDTLIEGRHFLPNTNPYYLGHKALAVNLSDLAAMGARPLGCLLNLAIPKLDHLWLQGFSDGFYALAEQSGCHLVGGDTTRSEVGITLTVTVFGYVKANHALRRSAAKPDDDIWLTGNNLGAPHIALQLLLGSLEPNNNLLEAILPTLLAPQPPIGFAPYLCGIANAGIDISDGLLQDLQHVLSASNCGAVIFYPKLPIHTALATAPLLTYKNAVLAGGDVYQLCFTAAPRHRKHIKSLVSQQNVVVSRIGNITHNTDLKVLDENGNTISVVSKGFDHFIN